MIQIKSSNNQVFSYNILSSVCKKCMIYKSHIAKVQYLKSVSYGIRSYCLKKHMSYCIHKKTKCATKLIHFSQNACLLYKIFVDYFRMLFSILGCFTGVFCTSSDIVYGLGNQIAMEAFISFTKFDV